MVIEYSLPLKDLASILHFV